MANGDKVVINLATGLEDTERVTVAFLVGGAALEQGKKVAMFLTKEAIRLGLPGHAEAVACEGCPPLSRLFQQYADGGGELLSLPVEWTDLAGVEAAFPGEPFFKEFAVRFPRLAAEVRDALVDRGFLAGVPAPWVDDGTLIVAVTERRTRQEIDALATAMGEVLAS